MLPVCGRQKRAPVEQADRLDELSQQVLGSSKRDPASVYKVESNGGRKLMTIFGLHMHTCTDVCEHSHTHTHCTHKVTPKKKKKLTWLEEGSVLRVLWILSPACHQLDLICLCPHSSQQIPIWLALFSFSNPNTNVLRFLSPILHPSVYET